MYWLQYECYRNIDLKSTDFTYKKQVPGHVLCISFEALRTTVPTFSVTVYTRLIRQGHI